MHFCFTAGPLSASRLYILNFAALIDKTALRPDTSECEQHVEKYERQNSGGLLGDYVRRAASNFRAPVIYARPRSSLSSHVYCWFIYPIGLRALFWCRSNFWVARSRSNTRIWWASALQLCAGYNQIAAAAWRGELNDLSTPVRAEATG